ncbi:hypothetical protein BC834DRAFT_140797 [Gloeopeniophorella convolvens]|nr:hypothetical protein BC834DRAFT_140797 [Gloeopeniophorella convolvens]
MGFCVSVGCSVTLVVCAPSPRRDELSIEIQRTRGAGHLSHQRTGCGNGPESRRARGPELARIASAHAEGRAVNAARKSHMSVKGST